MTSEQKHKKTSGKQIAAIIGILLLVAMYVMTFVFALTDNPGSMHMFAMSVVATIIVPVVIYAYIMIFKLAKDRRDDAMNASAGKFPGEDEK